MDQDLKQYLEAMESRINAHVDARVEKTEATLIHYVDARVEKTEANLVRYVDERVEKTETNLLTAFHGWARSMEIRVRGVSGITTGFDERLAHVEERVSELERRRAS